ncbi:MAG TPA: SRPBCC domain-containing protein [Myxococcales bacterium]
MTPKTQTPPAQVVTFERTWRATAREIWDLWTTRDGFESWWGPEGFRVEVSRIEPRLGGALHYAMIADAPEMVAAMKQMGQPAVQEVRGHYSGFEPHRRLQLTHIIDFFKGVPPAENAIDVELLPAGDHVRMVVTLHPMPTPELSRMQAEGFGSQLEKLDRRFA